jgi:cytochrome c-type biogenesis protein CcmH/NrfG
MSSEAPAKLWNRTQACAVALLCALLGIAIGYLLHAPKTEPENALPALRTVGPTNPEADTQAQMKQMADTQAKPVLAALQKSPDDPGLLAQLGRIYFRARQFAPAADYYGRAARIKPDAEIYVSLSNSYHYAGEDDPAFEALNRALALDPKCANALFNLGMLRWQVKNDPRGAIDAWQRLLKTNPNHPRRAEVQTMITRARQHMNLPAGATPAKPLGE